MKIRRERRRKVKCYLEEENPKVHHAEGKKRKRREINIVMKNLMDQMLQELGSVVKADKEWEEGYKRKNKRNIRWNRTD